MLTLRHYQQRAVDTTYDYLRRRDGNPLVVLPVGAGKSLVIAQIVKDAVEHWNGRVVMATHVQELVAQNAEKVRRLCPELPVGIYCSSLKKRELNTDVVCASIQSIFRRAGKLGPRDLLLIDEAHTCPPDGDGMYRKFLQEMKHLNPHLRVIGLTATPYRLSSGTICRPDGLFQEIACEVGLRSLIDEGFLSPLVSKAGAKQADLTNVPIRAGEFVPEAVERAMNQNDLVRSACTEIASLTANRTACLIFSAGVEHGRHMQQVLSEVTGQEVGFVSADTPPGERSITLSRFKGETNNLFDASPLKYVVNYGVLTTGFDCPRLDAIAVLRATQSPGLLVQMLGRGTRLHPGKANCLILDYGGNIQRHGPIDEIVAPIGKGASTGEAKAKVCPKCNAIVGNGVRVCPDCHYVFPPKDPPEHDRKASDADILSAKATKTTYPVLSTHYYVHWKRGANPDAPRTMRVDYEIEPGRYQSEWICLEHEGYAQRKAAKWWSERSPDPMPSTAERAVEIADGDGLAVTREITIKSVEDEVYDQIIGYKLGPMPEPCDAMELVPSDDADRDIPF